MKPYERFEAWRAAHDLALTIYRQTRHWPKSELYGLTSQARRAATSVPTNIAEGSAKYGAAEFRRLLDISLGSLSELSYLLRLARDLGFLTAPSWEEIAKQQERTGQLLWRLYRSLGSRSSPSAR